MKASLKWLLIFIFAISISSCMKLTAQKAVEDTPLPPGNYPLIVSSGGVKSSSSGFKMHARIGQSTSMIKQTSRSFTSKPESQFTD